MHLSYETHLLLSHMALYFISLSEGTVCEGRGGVVTWRLYRKCLNVDPFSPLESIEGYLWPILSRKKSEKLKSPTRALEEESLSHLLQDASTSQGKNPGPMELDATSTDAHEMQEVKSNLQPSVEVETVDTEQIKSVSNVNAESLEKGSLNSLLCLIAYYQHRVAEACAKDLASGRQPPPAED